MNVVVLCLEHVQPIMSKSFHIKMNYISEPPISYFVLFSTHKTKQKKRKENLSESFSNNSQTLCKSIESGKQRKNIHTFEGC